MKIRWIPLVLLCFLLSCTHSQKAPDKMAAKPPDIPSPVSFQVDKEPKAAARQPEDLYSFSLREANVKDILRAIAKQTDYNVVVEPDVKGLTTVDLKQVSLSKALEYILEPLNYAYKIEDRTVYVSRPKVETKIFTINYLSLKKTATSKVTWKEGGSSSTTTSSGTTSSEDKTLEIRSETESDLWKSLEDNLKPMLSADGKFAINRQAFTIMVADYPKNLKRVSMLLDGLEKPMHRQILIEAKIVEVILNAGSRQGINWKLVNTRVGSFANISVTQNFTTPADFSITQPVFRFFVGSPSSGELDISGSYVEALQSEYETQVLSNPKISTLNNQRAVIKATTQEVYFDESLAYGGSATPVATYTPKFMNVGIVLDVIPQIDENGNIILSVHPVYSTISSYVNSPNPDSQGRVPVITTREADTIVRIKDGETVVIAGLIQERKFKDRTGIKGLSSVPLLGQLFRMDTEEKRNTELVVFLTPKIIYAK
ncbi:MAG: secretin and TonB N-terminal domain-containing protein [Syntrophorhabdaceae bacterium]|nr:secretin and TonB N-terminal domain-containing protein [Syntrophorhabdaceae bacterium]